MSVELKKKINDILFSKYVLEGSKDVELENIENREKKTNLEHYFVQFTRKGTCLQNSHVVSFMSTSLFLYGVD